MLPITHNLVLPIVLVDNINEGCNSKSDYASGMVMNHLT